MNSQSLNWALVPFRKCYLFVVLNRQTFCDALGNSGMSSKVDRELALIQSLNYYVETFAGNPDSVHHQS